MSPYDTLTPYAEIRQAAHDLHASVNQHYDETLPYSVHLDMVVDCVMRYAKSVLVRDEDLAPLYFGAYFHDSIEDARLTYRDVVAEARKYMDEEQAVLAAEIVYALTNEKGRTRAERANDRYYEGIRATPYAPMVKLADRIANMTYSVNHPGDANTGMKATYAAEFPHFIAAINPGDTGDTRRSLPKEMIDEAYSLLTR